MGDFSYVTIRYDLELLLPAYSGLGEEIMMFVNTVLVVVVVVVGLTIVLYATWLLSNRLWNKDPKRKAFGEWLKNVFDGIWGL